MEDIFQRTTMNMRVLGDALKLKLKRSTTSTQSKEANVYLEVIPNRTLILQTTQLQWEML